MRRIELIFFALGSAAWVIVVLDLFAIVTVAGLLDLGFYPLYAAAGFLGSIAGNALVFRWPRVAEAERRPLLLGYLAAPLGMVVLLRGLASPALQAAAPLVPLWAGLVYVVFFVVPLTIRRPPAR